MLNRTEYKIKAKFLQTNRIRTTTVFAKSEEDAIEKIKREGFGEVVSIEKVFWPPSDSQVAYARDLGAKVTPDMCKEDLSAIISYRVDSDSAPNPDLIKFADSKDIVFSSYIGKKALYNLILYKLNDLDATAFFIFSIYRYYSNDRQGNLNLSRHKSKFYEFAELVVSNPSLLKSLHDNYRGADLRFFGTLKTSSEVSSSGGSRSTAIFKRAKQFLIESKLLTESAFFSPKSSYSFSKAGASTRYKIGSPSPSVVKQQLPPPAKKAGCLSVLMITIGLLALIVSI